MKTNTIQTIRKVTHRLAALLALVAAPSAFAASQIWSNAPTSSAWVTGANWIGNAAPGGINLTGTTLNNDVATFNTPLAGGIGGAGNPIIVDDATVAAARSRHLGGLTFDGVDCGPYVIYSPSVATLPAAGIPATGILFVSHNQTTRINAAVTNSQTILVPMRVRLPNSTAGQYNLVNDSTNPAANLIINTIIHDGANTRATTFNLRGSNTGNNMVTNLSEGAGNATGGFTKTGTGTWMIAGTSVFPAASPLNINEGTLAVLVPDAFGAATTATVTNSTLRFDGVTLNQASLNLRNGGNMQANGTVSVNGVAVGNQAGTTATLSTLNASDVFTVGTFLGGASLVTGGAADTVLNTAGPGTLVFGQANTYIGKWSFNAATNQITNPSALGTGANANVGAGAIFDLTVLGAGVFTPTTSGFGGSGTGTTVGTTAATVVADAGGTLDLATKNINLTFNPASASGDLTRPSLYIAQGTLALGGNTFFINNTGAPLGVGTYRLVEAASSITSGGGYAALVSGNGLVASAAAAIVVSGGNVDLVVTIYFPKNLVWSGTGADWDLATTSDWLDGVTPSVFNNSDNVTFNSVGSANPSVNLVGTLAPATVTVDTSANDYTFAGSGQIAGTASLTKQSAGVLTLQMANTYAGGTVVNNGTVRIGANNAISAVGSGDVTVNSPGVIDLNGFNNTVNGLLGNGTIDNQSGGASVLTVGNNDDGGTFSGVLANTSGTLALTKIGTGQVTLTAANTYTGPTVVSAGTLQVQHANALGSGASTVAVNGGNLRTTTSINVNSLTGAQGTSVANATGAGATIITHTGTGDYTGIISDGASGTVGVYIPSGSLRLNANNTYSGGTVVASGATLAVGVINPGGSGVPGTGGITASNNAIVSLPTSVSTSSQVPNNITNVDANGTVYFSSIGQANSFNGQFVGGANSTNVFSGPMSIGGNLSFANFLGTVVVSNGASVRLFTGVGIDGGGDNTIFQVEGNLFSRDVRNNRLGALSGSGSIGNASFATPGNYPTMIIGAKNLSTTFSGIVGASNSIVKVGSGNLTLNGISYSTNIVTLPDPFEPTNIVSFTLQSSRIGYIGSTTVSNGTLTIVAPNNLTNSASITLAGGTLDATQIGYATNQTTLDYNSVEQATNTVVVTSGVVEILDGQSLNGQGSLLGSVTTAPTSTMNVGNPLGTLAISGSISLNGTVNMDLNRSNLAQNSDRITAASFSGSGAVLNVTNVGPTLVSGTVFQLFSGAVSAFATVNLPATDVTGQIAYTWQNNLAANGTITLVTGLNPTPTPITSVVNGSNLELSWPLDHTGWTLQAQTNALTVGITANWFNVGGSTATNQMFMPIVPGNPTVFYRLNLVLP
ncbi:MAG: autotransporter-associated beta strand repeat-containing protein [Verrucomicrobiota bacterium]